MIDRCESCERDVPRHTKDEVLMCWDWAWCLPCRLWITQDIYPGEDIMNKIEGANTRRHPSSGVALIAEERTRQFKDERWSAAHDDTHQEGQLAMAAIEYAAPEPVYRMRKFTGGVTFQSVWPWMLYPAKKNISRIEQLTKAGALIAAEIDRLQRKEASDASEE